MPLPPQSGGPQSVLKLPSADLQEAVRACYWHDLRACGPDMTLEQRLTCVPALPYNALVWMIEGQARLVECAGRPVDEPLPPVFLAGAHRHAYRSMAVTPYLSFGLVFQPGVLGWLTGADAGSWAERIQPAQAALPADWHAWLDAVRRAPDPLQRIALCEDFLRPRWAARQPFRAGWSWLLRDAWRRSTRPLAARLLDWTPRHLQRRTRQLTGLTPGEIERLLRLERALLDLRDGRATPAQAAAEHGFADQPHFNREVRSHFRCSPGQLLQRLRNPASQGDWMLRL